MGFVALGQRGARHGPPQQNASAAELGVSADLRRQRAHLVRDLRGRSPPVDDAVGLRDLGGIVGGALLRRADKRTVGHRGEGGEQTVGRGAREQLVGGAGVAVGRHGHRALVGDRSLVDAGAHLERSHAQAGLAGHECAHHRRRAPPVRHERRMDDQ